MNLPSFLRGQAWEPLTPNGVARFAHASLGRLLLVQFFFALFAAAAIAWCLDVAWYSTIREGIRQLPETGEIRSGELVWPGPSPHLLAEGHFLAFVVDLDHTGQMRSPAHVQVEFGRSDARFISLLGYCDIPYPGPQWIVAFNRTEIQPWWGAWGPPMLWIVAAVVVAGMLFVWSLLALFLLPAAWLAGFLANRDLDAWRSWKLCGAALMPGALAMSLAILLYGSGVFDLVQLLAACVAHVAVGLGYALLSSLLVPGLAGPVSPKGNPFAGANPEKGKGAAARRSNNPFSSPKK